MNRLFSTLRGWRDKPPLADAEALPGFETRIEALYRHAQQAAAYENDLLTALGEVEPQLAQLEAAIEDALYQGADRDAFEYVRLLVRLRPQRDLIERELRMFHAVASALIVRVDVLMEHIDEARTFAHSATVNPAATHYLDVALTRLTRYFVMLDRVAAARRRALPNRLAALTLHVVDNRQLDLELAHYILERRRALGSG